MFWISAMLGEAFMVRVSKGQSDPQLFWPESIGIYLTELGARATMAQGQREERKKEGNKEQRVKKQGILKKGKAGKRNDETATVVRGNGA